MRVSGPSRPDTPRLRDCHSLRDSRIRRQEASRNAQPQGDHPLRLNPKEMVAPLVFPVT